MGFLCDKDLSAECSLVRTQHQSLPVVIASNGQGEGHGSPDWSLEPWWIILQYV